jgi:hypothetical protein
VEKKLQEKMRQVGDGKNAAAVGRTKNIRI